MWGSGRNNQELFWGAVTYSEFGTASFRHEDLCDARDVAREKT